MADHETKAEVRIYAAGTCDGDPGPGGWGAVLKYGQHEKAISGSATTTTSIRMELTAAVQALESLKRSCAVILCIDSAYVHELTSKRADAAEQDTAKNADLRQRLDSCMSRHAVSWRLPEDRTDIERAAQLAVNEMRKQLDDASLTEECLHGMQTAWCALCKPPKPGVLPHGYRTKGGRAYHNDPDCEWLLKGQRRSHRMGKNVHDKVRVAWGSVTPGELEPCESCCTPQWLKRHGY